MPFIALYGVCGRRTLSPFTTAWVPGLLPIGPEAAGTISLSRATFLDRYIVHPLALVNEVTTVVPEVPDIVKDIWDVKLTSHKHYKGGCPWTAAKVTSLDYLEYEWNKINKWTRGHEHKESTSSNPNGEYRLSCESYLCMSSPND